MLPPVLAAIICWATAWAVNMTASRLRAMVSAQSWRLVSMKREDVARPALLTRMVGVPNAAFVCASRASISSALVTSALTARAEPPVFLMFSTCWASNSGRRATKTVWAPWAANSFAKRVPRPDEAPVTIATLSFRSKSVSAFTKGCCAVMRSFPVRPE